MPTWCRRTWLLTVLAIVATTGCGGPKPPPPGSGGPGAAASPSAVPMAGTVTIDGKPEPGIQVIFSNEDGYKKNVQFGSMPTGPTGYTNDKGEFQITNTRLNDGVEPGEYLVVFLWFPGGSGAYFEDLKAAVPPEISNTWDPRVMPFFNKYKPGGTAEPIKVKAEAGKPQKTLKFDLTTN